MTQIPTVSLRASARPATTRLVLPALLAAGLALTGCGQAGDEASRTAPAISPEPTPAPVAGTGLEAPAKNDAAALSVLAAFEQNILDLTTHGIEHGLENTTGDFARELNESYRRELEETRRLGAGQDARAEALRARAPATIETLERDPTANAYRNAFMAAINVEHSQMLKILDAELIPGAQSEPVKAHLAKVRSDIAARYERAQAVVSSR